MSCWSCLRFPPPQPPQPPASQHLTCLSAVTSFSHRGVSAEPVQRAEQLAGRRWRRQLRRRHAVSSRRAEDRPADPGRAAHAQRPGHGAGRPCHRRHVQDGQAVTVATENRREARLIRAERSRGQDQPHPLLHGPPAVPPRPQLCEALSEGCATKTGGGRKRKKTSGGFPGNGFPLCGSERGGSALCAVLLCLQCIITRYLYPRPPPQKKPTFDIFFFSYPL